MSVRHVRSLVLGVLGLSLSALASADSLEWTPNWKKGDYWIVRSPLVRYFKYDEAIGFKGEFNGISKASRDEKLKLLVGVLEEFNPLGVAMVIPHDIFHKYFGKNDLGVLKHPYPISFYQIISRLYRHYASIDAVQKIEFVFDEQRDQYEKVMAGWQLFVDFAAPEHRAMIGSRPGFVSDIDVAPLQAADLHAGWVRHLDMSAIEGRSPSEPVWAQRGSAIQRINWVMTEDNASDIAIDMAKKLRGY